MFKYVNYLKKKLGTTAIIFFENLISLNTMVYMITVTC